MAGCTLQPPSSLPPAPRSAAASHADLARDRPERARSARLHLQLELPIDADQLASENRQSRTPAAAAALAAHRDPLPEGHVETLEQQPGAAVAHVQVGGGLRQRAGLVDALEQRDLAWSNGLPAAKVDSEADGGNWHAVSSAVVRGLHWWPRFCHDIFNRI